VIREVLTVRNFEETVQLRALCGTVLNGDLNRMVIIHCWSAELEIKDLRMPSVLISSTVIVGMGYSIVVVVM